MRFLVALVAAFSIGHAYRTLPAALAPAIAAELALEPWALGVFGAAFNVVFAAMQLPIGVALDMHANISRQMIENADITTVYQTNPHIDTKEQAILCANLVLDMVRGKIKPTTALETPPLLVNILNQGTADKPMSDLIRLADEQRKRPGVLSVSVVEGYPYADVAEMGMSFIAITDNNQDLANEIAKTLSDAAWSMRAALNTGGTPVDEALMRARAANVNPVVLFDVGDNVGGGSPADSTLVLHAARRLKVPGVLQA